MEETVRKKKNKPLKRGIMYTVDILLAALVIAGDQLAKHYAQTFLRGAGGKPFIPHIVELYYVENSGSAFGILEGQKILILFVSAVVMAYLCFLLIKLPTKPQFVWMHIALTLILAGGIGNCIDRIRLDYVVDFFNLLFMNFPVFNVADICVVCGVILLFILLIFVFQEQDLEFLRFKRNRYREIDE